MTSRALRLRTRPTAGLAAAVSLAMALGLILLLSGAGTASPTDDQQRLQQATDSVRDTGVSGVLSEVRSDDAVVRARSGEEAPFGAYTRVGSTTKTFTATVVLQLVGEGLLSLDDTVEERLPGVVASNGNDGSKISVRNLLQHTSGLYDYTADLPFSDYTPESFRGGRFTSYAPEELVDLATRQEPQWVPGPDESRWSYSNTNYVLAGMVIEAVTDNPWQQEVHDRIIEPLGLDHTYDAGTAAYLPEPRLEGHTRFPGRQELVNTTMFGHSWADAAGDMVSTTRDLTRFFRALFGGELLEPAQLEQMRQTVPAPEWEDSYPDARYGLGIAVHPVQGCEGGVWHHGGHTIGFGTLNGVSADGERSAVVAMGTQQLDGEAALQQQLAAVSLIDEAVCAEASP